jgi:hypothetical protein
MYRDKRRSRCRPVYVARPTATPGSASRWHNVEVLEDLSREVLDDRDHETVQPRPDAFVLDRRESGRESVRIHEGDRRLECPTGIGIPVSVTKQPKGLHQATPEQPGVGLRGQDIDRDARVERDSITTPLRSTRSNSLSMISRSS